MSSSTHLNPQISIFKTTPRRNATKLSFSAPASNSCPFQTLSQMKNSNLFHVNKLGFNPEKISAHELNNPEEDLGGNEFMELTKRLNLVMERFRVLETEKLMDRLKGDVRITDENKEEMEILSVEIVNKFLEKPMEYLSRGEEKLDVKLQDLKVLVEMLESHSCSEKKTSKSKCQRDSHVGKDIQRPKGPLSFSS